MFSPKLEEEFFKVADVFRFLLQVFPLFRLRKIKIRLRVFIFCGDKFFQRPKTYVTHCTSIATRWFSSSPRAMTSKNAMSLMSLLQSSDISDMRKTSTLHGGVLIFNGLWHPCNECNGIEKVNGMTLAFIYIYLPIISIVLLAKVED